MSGSICRTGWAGGAYRHWNTTAPPAGAGFISLTPAFLLFFWQCSPAGVPAGGRRIHFRHHGFLVVFGAMLPCGIHRGRHIVVAVGDPSAFLVADRWKVRGRSGDVARAGASSQQGREDREGGNRNDFHEAALHGATINDSWN